MKATYKFYHFLIIVLTFALSSCTEVLDIELDEESDRVVVEGVITNRVEPFKIKLSKTLSLSSNAAYPTIDNAFVTIADNTGNLDTLYFVSEGIYKTNGNRQGVVGRTYYLTVKIGAQTYVAQDILTAVRPIDDLFFVYQEAGDGLGIEEDGYYAYFNTTDPPDEKNYYYYEVYRNSESVLKSNQVGVFDDKFLAPVILYSRLPGKFNSQDKLLFKYYSISEKAFDYYNGIALQLQNDGGFFGTPPANAVNNISGGALGFFQTSSLEIDSLVAP